MSAKHGTVTMYAHGCRCEECCDGHYQYWHARRAKNGIKRPRSVGPRSSHVTIDPAELSSLLARDRRPRAHFERDAGLCQGAIYRVLERGRCTASTFDALCSALDINGYEIEAPCMAVAS